jgi:hypothetical protein
LSEFTYLAQVVNHIVMVEGTMRVEDETLNFRFTLIEPQSGLINEATTVYEDQASHLYIFALKNKLT